MASIGWIIPRTQCVPMFRYLISLCSIYLQVSLDAKVRAEIDNNMSNPDTDTFKCAQDHIFTLMYHDCFPRFIKSKHYKQLLKRH